MGYSFFIILGNNVKIHTIYYHSLDILLSLLKMINCHIKFIEQIAYERLWNILSDIYLHDNLDNINR